MAGARTVFLISVSIALSVLLLRPICATAHPHVQPGEAPACCLSVEDRAGGEALDQGADGFAKPLVAVRSVTPYFLAAAALPGTPRAYAGAPPRSFYERSARILR